MKKKPSSTYFESIFLINKFWIPDEVKDRCASRIRKGDDVSWLNDPIILHGNEDFNIPVTRPAWEGEKEVVYSFKNIEKAAGFFKDEALRDRFLAEGGVFHILYDTDLSFVAFLWLGKSKDEIDKYLSELEGENKTNEAMENFIKSVHELVKSSTREELIRIIDEAIVKEVITS